MGIKLGKDRLFFSKDAEVPTLNGQALEAGKTYQLNGQSVIWDGANSLTIKSDEYSIEIKRQGSDQNRYLDHFITISDKGVNFDGVMPHGLLGQTADGDGQARQGKKGAQAQGEGAIEGVYTDYEVADLFADNFKFNRYKGN